MTLRKVAMLGLAAGMAVVPVTAAIAAKVVVVRSIGPSAKTYPPGKALSDSTSIKLEGGDIVTLIGPSSSKTLRGPGTFTAATPNAQMAMASGRRGRFGALRTGEVAKNPSLWDLDATQNGKMCIADASKLNLWRPNAETAAKISISGGGKSQTAEFGAGENKLAWPAKLPVKDGSEYQVTWVESGERNKMNFVTVSSPPTDLPGAAQLLIEKGCEYQLDLLVDSAAKAR
jgi:hypothetical protein